MNNDNCNENFLATEGLAMLWDLTSQPHNIVFHSPDADLDGMAYFESEYRWPAVNQQSQRHTRESGMDLKPRQGVATCYSGRFSYAR